MTTPLPDQDAEALGIASALIKARSELGYTQAQLSDLSGVSRSAIKGYETGRNMPGSRELKALCKALKVSPNALLFGTETPFSGDALDQEDARAFRAVLAEPEDEPSARARLVALAVLLTKDERSALLQLVQGLAVARHGPEVVQQQLLGADMLAGMMRTMMAESERAVKTGEPVDPKRAAEALEQYMDRRGHLPPKKP